MTLTIRSAKAFLFGIVSVTAVLVWLGVGDPSRSFAQKRPPRNAGGYIER